jgi:hypothetical protein
LYAAQNFIIDHALQNWWVREWGRNNLSIFPAAPPKRNNQKQLSYSSVSMKAGTIDSAWMFQGAWSFWRTLGYETNTVEKREGSYSFNAWLGMATIIFGDGTAGPVNGPSWLYSKDTEIEAPDNTPLFCDGIDFRHMAPSADLLPGKNLQNGDDLGEFYGQKAMWAITIPRHGSRPLSAFPLLIPRPGGCPERSTSRFMTVTSSNDLWRCFGR